MKHYEEGLLLKQAKHGILVTGGIAPKPSLLRSLRETFPEAPCYCADAGADLCYLAEVLPDALIGDMDSLAEQTREWLRDAKVPEMVYPSEKDYSDTQLAVEALYDKGVDEIIVIGALGGRMDHELANMMLLVTYGRQGKSLVYWDDINRMRYIGVGEHRLDRVNGYVGIVPFTDDGMRLSIEGMYYPLKDTAVPFGESRLISNVFTDEAEEAAIDITCGDGVLVLCKDRYRAE